MVPYKRPIVPYKRPMGPYKQPMVPITDRLFLRVRYMGYLRSWGIPHVGNLDYNVHKSYNGTNIKWHAHDLLVPGGSC